MIEVLYTAEKRQDELIANIMRDRPEIEKAVKKACKVLNKLTPDGALYASGWIIADLIVSLMSSEEEARELSRIVQGQIQREFKTAYANLARGTVN
ncbi:hypothetical protein [Mesorhizobium sp. LSHC412B00]|uniref:hypothetical protein n=1 Tax=Mesorhizobium sp. LSHC412B00 TaxID=1287285 RepID=UPI0003CF2F18|nr:hypothetical protein [Mesorhizobium sp. LSHC412B00]ESX91301.1 hypothetical protein X756_02385 [Mesorhizobium sp. LSHC412B00]